MPPAPVTKKAFEGYKNWVRFMADYYRGTVAYWEIQNEPVGFGWEVVKDPDERLRIYCELVKAAAPVIRKTDAKVKISLAGQAGPPAAKPSGIRSPDWPVTDWLYKCLDQGVGPLVDTIGRHIQGTVIPGTAYWDEYPKAVRAMKQYAESKGFRGKYLASEYWAGAPYPVDPQFGYQPDPSDPLKGKPELTDICKAKDAARVFAMNAGLDVVTFWCNTWIQTPMCDSGLFRNGFAADPVIPAQPEPAYYVLRTLATVLDETAPAKLKVEWLNKAHKIESCGFRCADDSLMLAAWLPGKSVDKHPGVTTDLAIAAPKCGKAIGIDILNGFEQQLQFREENGRIIVRGLVLRDYPLMLRLAK
jgi:hypothetical protein